MWDIKWVSKQDDKGSLTVEASIALTAFMFFVVTVLSLGQIYHAQGVISHATLQASQSLAIESYYRETMSSSKTLDSVSKIVKFLSALGWDSVSVVDDEYASLGAEGTDFYKFVREAFIYSIADSEDAADVYLESVGIVNGLDGLDFSYSAVKSSDIIINVQYKVELPFAFFGEREISLSKSAKTKAFKKISDDNGYTETEESDGTEGRF